MDVIKKINQLGFKWVGGLSVLIVFVSLSLQAQEIDENGMEIDPIEAEIQETQIKKIEETVQEPPSEDQEKPKKIIIKSVSDLRTLEEYFDIAVIQPRLQPKSKRFQLNASGGAIINNPWFNIFGVSLRGDYQFTESLGIELAIDQYSGSAGSSATDLADNLNVQINNFVQTKSYYGLHGLWAPFYGKLTLFNNKIVPFDVFFTVGAGQSAIEGARSSSVVTYHFGAGQLFAIDRNLAFRWDIRMNQFQTESRLSSSSVNIQNVVMMVGVSYFLPTLKR